MEYGLNYPFNRLPGKSTVNLFPFDSEYIWLPRRYNYHRRRDSHIPSVAARGGEWWRWIIIFSLPPTQLQQQPPSGSVILNDVDERHWEWNSYASAMDNLSSNDGDDDDAELDEIVPCGCDPTAAVMIDMQQHPD